MKKLKVALGLGIAIAVVSPMAISQAATAPSQVVTHHYSCVFGILDGSNCDIPANPGTPDSVTHVDAVDTLVKATSCPYGGHPSGWLDYDVNGYSSYYNIHYMGLFCYQNDPRIAYGIEASHVLTCPQGILNGSVCDVVVPGTPSTPARVVSAVDNPTTAIGCPNGYTLSQDQNNCTSPMDAQNAAVLSPFNSVNGFLTGKLIPGAVILFVLGLTFTLVRKVVKKYAKI